MQALSQEERLICRKLFAMKTNCLEVWKNFFDNYPQLRNQSLKTAIYYAVLYNKSRCVKLLLQFDASMVNNRGLNDESLLHVAAEKGHMQMLRLLLFRNPNLLSSKTLSGRDSLYYAVQQNNMEIVDFLLLQMVGQNTKDWFHSIFESAKHAAEQGYVAIIEAICKHFPKYHYRLFFRYHDEDESLLHIAIAHNQEKMVDFFAKVCSNEIWVKRNGSKELPLVWAIEFGCEIIISIAWNHTCYDELGSVNKDKILNACINRNELSIFCALITKYPRLLFDARSAIENCLIKTCNVDIAKILYERFPEMLTPSVFVFNSNENCFFYYVSQRLDLFWTSVECEADRSFIAPSQKCRCRQVLVQFPQSKFVITPGKQNTVLHLMAQAYFELADYVFALQLGAQLIQHTNTEAKTAHDVALNYDNKNMLTAMEPYVSLDQIIAGRKKCFPQTLYELLRIFECTNLIFDVQKTILEYLA